MTLLNDDNSSPLAVEQRFIRPENLYNGFVLEEGSVVDAQHKDRWWKGVVLKKMEDDNYLVHLDLRPGIVQFERKHLRPHLHWTGSEWIRPEAKELSKSMFSHGTMVEVSCSVIDTVEVSWVSAMIIKEIEESDEKKFIVKFCNNHLRCSGDEAKPNMTVDSRRVRPTPPPCSVETYDLLECVEVFHGSSWRQGLVIGVLSEKQYMVSLEATKEDLVFKHSDLRPFMVWEDGVWHNRPKRTPVEEAASNVVKKKPMCSSPGARPVTLKRAIELERRSLNTEANGETLTVAATEELGKKSAGALVNDSTPPVITPKVTSLAKEYVSHVTPLKQTESKTEGKKSPEKTLELMGNQKGLGNDSTRQMLPEEENNKDESRKRKREQQHNSGLNETDGTCTGSEAEICDTGKNICNDDDVNDQPLSTELSSYQSPNVVNSLAADIEETQAKGARTISPFAKKLPFWKTYETNELYKTVPQSPHFSPLFKASEDIREWSAVGMMVTFYGLLEEVKDLQLNVSSSKLISLSSSFAELEKHGFNVADPQSRISKVLSLQAGRAKKTEERQCLEKKIEAKEIERQRFKEEMAELERKILEMKGKEEVAGKRIVEMKSCAETIDQEIRDVEHEFQTTVSAPW